MNKIEIYKKVCQVTLKNTENTCNELYNNLLETGNFKKYYPDMMKSLTDAALCIRYKDSWIYGNKILTPEEIPMMQDIYNNSVQKLKEIKAQEMQRSIEYKCKMIGGIA